MTRENGWVVDDRTLLCTVDNIHWNELCAEWQDIEGSPNTLVLVEDILNQFSYRCQILEDVCAIKLHIPSKPFSLQRRNLNSGTPSL